MKQKSFTQIFILLTLMLAVVVLSSGCAKEAAKPTPETPAVTEEAVTPTEPQAGLLELTLDQLGTYNGKNGQPAYVAVEGIIYDVSAIDSWENGEHKGFKAGNDLTKEIKAAPHGVSVLKDLPVVGKIIT